MGRSKIIKEWLEVSIDTEGQTIKKSVEVSRDASKIIGLALSSNRDDLLYFRGQQKVTIVDKEIYPSGYESKLLMFGINMPVNERIIDLGEELDPGNRKVEMEYSDVPHPSLPFAAYKVRLYVFSRIACHE